MRRYFIVVAGGKGLRMGQSLPKQFIVLGGKPVLMHTLEQLHKCEPDAEIILVLPKEHESYWTGLVKDFHFELQVRIAYGGVTRYQSVKNGLELVSQEDDVLVAVHDGVRPFVSEKTVHACFETAQRKGCCIPVVCPVESVRLRESDGETEPYDRNRCYLVQTPQVFKAGIIRRAYAKDFQQTFTDDASVVEANGEKVFLVEGDRENIKLTTPLDLLIAGALINR